MLTYVLRIIGDSGLMNMRSHIGLLIFMSLFWGSCMTIGFVILINKTTGKLLSVENFLLLLIMCIAGGALVAEIGWQLYFKKIPTSRRKS